MDRSTNQSNPAGNQGKAIDFVPKKSGKDESAPESPRAVTSAKDAINAMYAERAKASSAKLVPSAREAVNSAASKTLVEQQKSAATLHHGSIQKKMESTRTSASALLKVAKSEKPSPDSAQPINSFDPLAKPKPIAKKPSRPRQVAYGSVPVVRTSLKLGASARPQPAPVVLPPHARMAQGARPVGSTSRPKKLPNLLNRRLVDAEVVPPAQPTAPVRPRRLTADNVATPVDLVAQPSTSRRSAGPIRDPQMVRPSQRSAVSSAARRAAQAARTADIVDGQIVQAPRFATAPKGYTSQQPEPMSSENAYVMSEPPKLSPKKSSPAPQKPADKLGVVESYHQPRDPQPLGDKAPIGRVAEQKVASGHGGAAQPSEKVKADNTSNYSFSRHLEPDANRYALGGQSPFLKSVNVEKRPLSSSAPQKSEPKKLPASSSTKPAKSRKNIYPKKETAKTTSKRDLPSRPTVIVPSSHRSKAPLFFLMVLTIILGAAVGAAAYLCFFQ